MILTLTKWEGFSLLFQLFNRTRLWTSLPAFDSFFFYLLSSLEESQSLDWNLASFLLLAIFADYFGCWHSRYHVMHEKEKKRKCMYLLSAFLVKRRKQVTKRMSAWKLKRNRCWRKKWSVHVRLSSRVHRSSSKSTTCKKTSHKHHHTGSHERPNCSDGRDGRDKENTKNSLGKESLIRKHFLSEIITFGKTHMSMFTTRIWVS